MKNLSDVAYDELKSIMVEAKECSGVHYHKSLVLQRIRERYISGLDDAILEVVKPCGVVNLEFIKAVNKQIEDSHMLNYLIDKGVINA